MKTKLLSTLLILTFISITTVGCKSESKNTPHSTFKNFITATKSDKPEAVFAYYDWEGLYQRKQEEYQRGGIISAAELQAAVEGIFKDATAFMREKMLSQLNNTLDKDNPEYERTKQMLENIATEMGKGMERTIKEEREKDKTRTFALLDVTEEGDTAKGDFEITEPDGTKRQEKIEFIKKDGKWLIAELPSPFVLPMR